MLSIFIMLEPDEKERTALEAPALPVCLEEPRPSQIVDCADDELLKRILADIIELLVPLLGLPAASSL